MWHVVKFPQENTVAVVPASWYVQESSECFWPPKSFKRTDFSKFVKNQYLPGEHWKPYPASILGTYDDYTKTCRKAAKAQDSDKLSTEVDEDQGRGKRKRKTNQRYSPKFGSHSSSSDNGDSEDSCEFPRFPRPLSNLENNEEHVLIRDTQTPTSQNLSGISSFSSKKSFPIRKETANKSKTLFRTFSRSLSPDDVRLRSNTNRVEKRSDDNSHETIVQLLHAIHEDNKEFKSQVMRKLNLINLKLLDVETDVANIIKNKKENVEHELDDDLTKIMDTLPVNNANMLETIENWLSSGLNKAKMAKELSRIGGLDVGEVVKRIMYKTFTNELGLNYSWEGAKGKQKFKNLNVANVIIEAVRLNTNTKDATEVDVIINIKKWLVRCKDRVNNSLRKEQAATRPNEEQDEIM